MLAVLHHKLESVIQEGLLDSLLPYLLQSKGVFKVGHVLLLDSLLPYFYSLREGSQN